MEVVNKLVQIRALVDDVKLCLPDVLFNLLQLWRWRPVFIAKNGFSWQRYWNPKLLPRILDELLTGNTHAVKDFSAQVVVTELRRTTFLSIFLDDWVFNFFSLFDMLFEVFSEEHEHIRRSLQVLRRVDHED